MVGTLRAIVDSTVRMIQMQYNTTLITEYMKERSSDSVITASLEDTDKPKQIPTTPRTY